MGIRQLNRFIQASATNYMKRIPLTELSGKTIAVDTSIYMYNFIAKKALFDEFYLMIHLMLSLDITPIFIFDGRPVHNKNKTMQLRNKIKVQKEKQLQTIPLEQKYERKQLEKQCIRITSKETKIVKELMDVMGVVHLDAPYEADELCAKLVLDKTAYACLSDDTDMFVYGCPKILRLLNLFEETVTIYDMSRILRCLKMNQTQFRDMCILSGTDYNDGEHSLLYYYNIFKEYKRTKTKQPFYEWLYHQGKAGKPLQFTKVYLQFDLRAANYHELKVFEKILPLKKTIQGHKLNELLRINNFHI